MMEIGSGDEAEDGPAAGSVALPIDLGLDVRASWDGSDLLNHRDPLTGALDPACWSETERMVADLSAVRGRARWAGCTELLTVADWADLHPGEGVAPVRVPGQERGVRVGGEGTPLVAEFAIAEMSALLERSVFAGRGLLADVMDLRHRLPRLWGRIARCEVEAWQARKIAQTVRPLSLLQSRRVDARVAGHVGQLPWSRMQALVDAEVIAADPDRAARLAEQAHAETKVHIGQTDEHGLVTLYARLETPDAVWMKAQIARLAGLLETVRGDTRPIDQRNATALGLLARPAEAIKLLLEQSPPTTTADAGTDTNLGTDAGAKRGTGSGAGTEAGSTSQSPFGEMARGTDVPPPDEFDDPERPEPAEDSPVDPVTAAILDAIGRLDSRKLAPPVVLYAHLAWDALSTGNGVCRLEGVGPIVAPVAQRWLGDANVTVKPVINLPAGQMPIDAYELTPVMREHLTLRHPFSVFPHAVTDNRRCDGDHSDPYRWPPPDEPPEPGQTGLHNAGPLARFEHRLVTHAGWQRRQPEPGSYLFRAPHRHLWLINNTGTHHLGAGPLADAIWHTVTA